MIKIFSSDKIIFLINNQNNFLQSSGNVLVNIQSERQIKEAYSTFILSNDVQQIYFYNADENLLLSYFKSMFKIIEAAGGLVKNKKNEYLFIFRNGKWDLPKGKIEKGETIEIAAIREVEEECGVNSLKITKQILITYHTYFVGEREVLKPTYWFEMECDDSSKLVPQKEEGITDVRWIAKKDFSIVKENTYESILDVIATI